MKKLLLLTLLTAATCQRAHAASPQDIDKLTTYSVIIGRAIGCGYNVDSQMRSVGRWIDSRFPPGSQDQKTYLPVFLTGVEYHAQQQSQGKSPDSCASINKTLATIAYY